MKKLFTGLSLIIFLFAVSCSEKRIEKHNTKWDGEKTYQIGEDKPFDGVVESKDSDGRIKKETKFKNGEKIESVEFYKDGSVKSKKEGHGDKQYYNPDGEEITSDEYSDSYRGQ